MTKDELMLKIAVEIVRRGLLWHTCSRATEPYCHGTPGLPELIITGRDGVIFRSLAAGDQITSGPQDRWAAALTRSGNDWAVWRPADFDSGLIGRELDQLQAGG
jgi:hypothetical protein